MKGFIFGFQRFVWCPKWTPASNNSGTNSVVSAIREISRGRELPEREQEDATAPVDAQPEIQHSDGVDSYCSHNDTSGVGFNWRLVIFSQRVWQGSNRDRKVDSDNAKSPG